MKNIKPTLIIIAGPNGSGKTTITSKILKHEWVTNCIYINPDEIAKEKFGDWNSVDAILKAAEYSTNLRNEAIKVNQSLIFETVFSSNEKIEFISLARQKGYFIRFFFVGTEHPTINASRIVRRVLQGGHDVPITKIISRYAKSIMNCAFITKNVDRLYVYDNSIDFVEAKLLFRASDGIVTKKYEQTREWAMPIYNSLRK
jgi:predicted ABC-type ATPase